MIIPILILFFVLVVEMVLGNGLFVNSGMISGADGAYFRFEVDVVRLDILENGGCGKPGAFVSGLCVAIGKYIVARIVNLKHSVFNIPVKCMFAGFKAFSNRVLCCGSSQFAGFTFISKAFTFSTPAFVTYSIAAHSIPRTLLASSCLSVAILTGISSIASYLREAAVSGNLFTYSYLRDAAFLAASSRALPQFHSPFFTRT